MQELAQTGDDSMLASCATLSRMRSISCGLLQMPTGVGAADTAERRPLGSLTKRQLSLSRGNILSSSEGVSCI